jgi:ribonuclease HII
METVIINATINEKKKIEFFQTIESLKSLVKNYCNELETIISEDNNLSIRITFSDHDEMENNFYNAEFNILKGSVMSLCKNVNIKINDVNLS